MSSAPTPQEIWKDARWLVQAVDPNAGLLRAVEMTDESYREASFLDDRMFQHQPRTSHLLKWREVADAMPADARRDARWIFHISHVGSTLISRLLGELDGVLSIREPRAFRDLTFFPPEVRGQFVPTVQALFSRTFGESGAALVKTTSFISEIATELIPPGQPALFLYTKPRSFMAGILSGENSRKELAARSMMRSKRLAERGAHLPAPLSEADMAAAAWACEMIALEATEDRVVRWADFDRTLDDLPGSLRNFADFFGFEASDERLREIATGPLTRRYSKAMGHEFSAGLRSEILAEAGRRFRADIDAALAMLERAAETAPLLRRALDRAEAEG